MHSTCVRKLGFFGYNLTQKCMNSSTRFDQQYKHIMERWTERKLQQYHIQHCGHVIERNTKIINTTNSTKFTKQK